MNKKGEQSECGSSYIRLYISEHKPELLESPGPPQVSQEKVLAS